MSTATVEVTELDADLARTIPCPALLDGERCGHEAKYRAVYRCPVCPIRSTFLCLRCLMLLRLGRMCHSPCGIVLEFRAVL